MRWCTFAVLFKLPTSGFCRICVVAWRNPRSGSFRNTADSGVGRYLRPASTFFTGVPMRATVGAVRRVSVAVMALAAITIGSTQAFAAKATIRAFDCEDTCQYGENVCSECCQGFDASYGVCPGGGAGSCFCVY